MRDLSKEKSVVIFGVGDIGTDLYHRLLQYEKCPVKCFCDNNPNKQGTQMVGMDILSPKDAVSKYPSSIFIITVINHTQAVRQQLLKLGVDKRQMVVFTKNDYINVDDEKRQRRKQTEYREWCLKYNSKIKEMKGKFAGKRCFILGNGGSLTVNDLEMLKGEYTFGCNRLYMMFDRLSWRPHFYCFYDVQRVKKLKKDIPYILDNCDCLFTSSTIKDELEEKIIDSPKTFFVHMEKEKYYPNLPKFSENPEQLVYDGQTVLYMATQIAVYLGFDEIYYLGVDNHYSVELNLDGSIKRDNTVKDYPEGMGGIELETSVIPQMELTTMSFEAVKKYADEHGIAIYNATRGGHLDVFERVNLDSLF